MDKALAYPADNAFIASLRNIGFKKIAGKPPLDYGICGNFLLNCYTETMRYLSIAISIACAAALWLTPATADVFKYRDAQGRIYLTDTPMEGGYRLLKKFSFGGDSKPSRSDTWAKMRQRRDRLAPLIEAAAIRSRLKPELVHAVVRAESAYRTDAVSSKGAVGLMQLMPATARRLGVSDSYDARQNLDGGTRYLRQLLEMFDKDLRLALAAYNAGENAVIRYGRKVPPFPETQNYVKKVIGFYTQNQAGDKLAQR